MRLSHGKSRRMANPSVAGSSAQAVTLPPIHKIDTSDHMPRGSMYAPGAVPALSDERSPVVDRSPPDLRPQRPSIIPTGYSTSPPPMPVVPPGVPVAPTPEHEVPRAGSRDGFAPYSYYTFPSRASSGYAVMPLSESATIAALERVNNAAYALYNISREHLEMQAVPTTEALHNIILAVADINHDMRTITSSDTRLRELSEIVPSYPRPLHLYWGSARDDRESRRADDSFGSDKGSAHHSPQNKFPMRLPRIRGTEDPITRPSGSFDVPYEHARVDGVYTMTYPPNSGRHGTDHALPYVPKYRKRSRAPGPGVCHSCGNNETPEWRRGPDGARTLCNACGLHFAKLVRRRAMQYNGAPGGTQIPPVTIAELRASINVGGEGNRAHGPHRRNTEGSSTLDSQPPLKRSATSANTSADLTNTTPATVAPPPAPATADPPERVQKGTSTKHRKTE